MTLPETITAHYTAEDAGYLAMSPVVTQTFRLGELIDMIVQAGGKDASRVRHILQAGSVHYHGFHYHWPGFEASAGELASQLERFPDDDPERPFDPATVTLAVVETGGGPQLAHAELEKEEASGRKLWSRRSAWGVLLAAAEETPPHYEKYDHARHGDCYRLNLDYARGVRLLSAMRGVAPRSLRHHWDSLHPPSAVLFISSRASAARA